jgi:hypothetical protein
MVGTAGTMVIVVWVAVMAAWSTVAGAGFAGSTGGIREVMSVTDCGIGIPRAVAMAASSRSGMFTHSALCFTPHLPTKTAKRPGSAAPYGGQRGTGSNLAVHILARNLDRFETSCSGKQEETLLCGKP